MAQPNPDEKKSTLEQVLTLVSELTPDEQAHVLEELKLQGLRRKLEKADESAANGKVRPAEEVFGKLEEKYHQRKKTGK